MRTLKSFTAVFSVLLLSLFPPAARCGSFDYVSEKIGELKLGMTEDKVAAALPGAKPPRRGPVKLFGADGLYHQTWTFPDAGVELDLASASANGMKTVEAITISPPCKFQTSREIRIGSSAAQALKAYKAVYNKQESKPGQSLVFGSVFGGLIVSVKDGKVSGLFLGAAAE